MELPNTTDGYPFICDLFDLFDYGMAKEVEFEDRPLTNEVGSLYYRAP